MGLLSGSITFKPFRVDGKLPRDFKEKLTQQLPRFAFREINPKVNPEMSIGWVNSANPLDADLTVEKVLFGKYLIAGLRKDRKAVPAAILKARVAEAIRAVARERKGKKIGREQITAIKDTVKEHLLAGISPTTALYEMVWNYETQEVYLSTLARKAADEFIDLFKETFDLELIELSLPTRVELFSDERGLDLDLGLLETAGFTS